MLPVIQIGPLAVQLPGLILLIGIWVGLSISEKYAHHHSVDPSDLYNLTFIGVIAGILGARLSFIVQFPSAFQGNPASIVSLNPGLTDPIGGIAIGIGAAIIYGQRKKLVLLPTLDAFTPTFAVLSIALSLANLASGDGFGTPTDLPWAIELWGTYRHPSQVYDALAASLILWIIYPERKHQKNSVSGYVVLQFLSLTAGAQIFLGAFKSDATFLPNGVRISQIIAWLILAGSFWGLEKILPTRENKSSNTSTLT